MLTENLACSASANRRCQTLEGLEVPTVLGMPMESIRALALRYSLIACQQKQACQDFENMKAYLHVLALMS